MTSNLKTNLKTINDLMLKIYMKNLKIILTRLMVDKKNREISSFYCNYIHKIKLTN